MRNHLIDRLSVVAILIVCFLVHCEVPGSAQQVCRGDVDGDGIVTAADVEALMPFLFDTEIDPLTAQRADANADGIITGADLAAILRLDGVSCASPTPSSTPTGDTPTPTVTRTPSLTTTPSLTPTPLTPTLTFTPRPTATPTQVCISQVLPFGTTDGELTLGDCQRGFDVVVRHTDVYTLVGTPGQAITVDVTSTSTAAPIVPFVAVIDADGQFYRVDGLPPIQFVVTSPRAYQILVTSSPTVDEQLGPYRVTVTTMACPTPVALTIPTSRAAALDGTECAAPGAPTTKTRLNLADIYTFAVTQVPTNVSIVIRQLIQNSDMDPAFSLLGPDGTQVVTPDQDDDSAPGGFGVDAQARFLALQPGTYTIITTGNGCDPSKPTARCQYSLNLTSPPCTATPLSNIPQDSPLNCAGSDVGCQGMLYGDTSRTTCAAPLPIPKISDGVPEPNSAADLYTFAAQTGDVISVEMDSDDDAHVFLLGPASAGNPLVAEDDDSGSPLKRSDSQLAATLALPGTYTMIATNNNALLPPSPPDDPVGDIVNYRLFVQKCPTRAVLSLPGSITRQFHSLDCLGFGNIPFRTYVMGGTAGQFVSIAMSSADLDAFVRVFAPDGTQVSNDNDLFDGFTSNARVNRILPLDGSYIIEVSSSLSQGAPDLTVSPPPAFTLQARTCATTAVAPGTVSGTFQDSDCELAPGRKYDVYTFAGPLGPTPAPRVASLLPPSNGCVVALLSEGPQTPASGCSRDLVDVPVVQNGKYGFIIAASDDQTRGAYTARFNSCPVTSLGYDDVQVATLMANDCAAANGAPADWFLLRAGANLVRFNDGISGRILATFPVAGTITDVLGTQHVIGAFTDDSLLMFPFKDTLASLIRISGDTPAALGSYTVQIDPAQFQQ